MSNPASRKINAKEIVADIRTGMTDEALMSKYQLSAKGLLSLFDQLIKTGLIEAQELSERNSTKRWESSPKLDISTDRRSIKASRSTPQPNVESKQQDGTRSQNVALVVVGFLAVFVCTSLFLYKKYSSKQGNQNSLAQDSQKRSVDRKGPQTPAAPIAGTTQRPSGTAGQQPISSPKTASTTSGKDIDKALLSAAYWGNPLEILELLQQGSNINARDDRGNTPLQLAASAGKLEAMKLLLDNGADINAKDNTGNTPLLSVARAGKLEVMKLLLDMGADPNAQNETGESVLMKSIYCDDPDLFKLLLDKGADPNVRERRYGDTVLHKFAYTMLSPIPHFREKLQMTMDRGADPGIRNQRSWTPMDTLFFTPGGQGNPNQAEALQLFLTKQIDVNSFITVNKSSLLVAAAATGAPASVQVLLDKGADVNRPDPNGTTALAAALLKGKVDNVKILIGKRADVNAKDRAGNTPLGVASAGGHTEIVKILLSSDADPNALTKAEPSKMESKEEATPLMISAREGHLTASELLVAKGADVNAINAQHLTPLMMASGNNKPEVVELLLANKADVNAKDRFENTPLIIAAGAGHSKVVEILLKAGADVNPKNAAGATALNEAEVKKHNRVVELLKAHGAK